MVYLLRTRRRSNLRLFDGFCGCGGSSLGCFWAAVLVVLAINHNRQSLDTHQQNFPDARHDCLDITSILYEDLKKYPIADFAWFSAECFPSGTLILTEHGLQPIEEVQVGTRVLTHRNRWMPVTRKMRSVKDTISVKGHGHYGLEVTDEHPFFARKDTFRAPKHFFSDPEWIPAGDLQGAYWATPTTAEALPIPPVGGRGVEFCSEFWWMVGRWIGDGSVRLYPPSSSSTITISCGKHEVDELESLLNYSPALTERARWGEYHWRRREVRTAFLFEMAHYGLATWLIEHFGKLAEGKEIPSWALTMPVEWRRALLDGYISADGSQDARKVQCSTVSRKLAIGIRLLAESLDYRVALHRYSPRGHSIEGRQVNDRPFYHLTWLLHRKHDYCQVTNGHSWARVRDIQPARSHIEVFNLSVAEDESYVADGLVVHNCTNHSNASGVPLLNQNQLPLWDDLDTLPYVERSRATMWEGLRWMEAMNEHGSPYLAVVFENVNNVMLWRDIRKWYEKIDALGYRWQTISLNSRFAQAAFPPEFADRIYPVGQSRNRWYTICTRKENPAPDMEFCPRAYCSYCACEVESVQTWKECALWRHPRYGDYEEQYVYTCPLCRRDVVPFFTPAYALIDWDIPIQRIGERSQELAETTLRRVQKGLQRFCRGGGSEPFLIDTSHTQSESGYVRSIWDACFTQTQAQTAGVVVPPGVEAPPFVFHTMRTRWEVEHKVSKAIERMDKAIEKVDNAIERARSVVRRERALEKRRALEESRERLVNAEWAAYQAEIERYERELPVFLKSYRERPIAPSQARNAFVASYYNGSDVLVDTNDAIRTCSSIDRHGLCIPPTSWKDGDGIPRIEDCLYRTLRSKETKRAMGIPESYEIVATSQREETRQCGLAVTPAVATLIMHRILASLGESTVLNVA